MKSIRKWFCGEHKDKTTKYRQRVNDGEEKLCYTKISTRIPKLFGNPFRQSDCFPQNQASKQIFLANISFEILCDSIVFRYESVLWRSERVVSKNTVMLLYNLCSF